MNAQGLNLQGRNIVVTGAAQGIGRAIGNLVLELGGNVTAVDLNAEGVQAFAAEAGADRVLAMAGSVTDAAFAQAVVEQGVARFGAVHGLVNNAGVTRPAMIEKMTLDQWQHGDRRAPDRVVPLSAGRRPSHACALPRRRQERRLHRQRLVGCGPPGHHRPDQLWRRQGRPARHDHVRGARMGQVQRARQHHWLRRGGDADDGDDPQREIRRHLPRSRFRWGAGRKPEKSRGRCASCFRTPLPTSRASTCRPTAATRSACEHPMSQLLSVFRYAALPQSTQAFREPVREFLRKAWQPEPPEVRARSWMGFDAYFSRKLASAAGSASRCRSEYGGAAGRLRALRAGRGAARRRRAGGRALDRRPPERAADPEIRHRGAARSFYLPRICRGEAFFCIGMSEPDSGSDLASVRTRATRVRPAAGASTARRSGPPTRTAPTT